MTDIKRYALYPDGISESKVGEWVDFDDNAAIVAQLEAELAQSQAALKMAREWSKSDKWRFSEVAQEYAAWENYVDVLDAAIKEQQ